MKKYIKKKGRIRNGNRKKDEKEEDRKRWEKRTKEKA